MTPHRDFDKKLQLPPLLDFQPVGIYAHVFSHFCIDYAVGLFILPTQGPLQVYPKQDGGEQGVDSISVWFPLKKDMVVLPARLHQDPP